jgi:hypothetical protein
VLLLSAPSTTRLLSVPRWPAKLMSPVRTSRVTPGVRSAKSMKFRPLTGRFCTAVSVMVELTCERVASMTGVPPETLTVSTTPDTASCTLSETTCPMVTMISGSLRDVNPESSTVTS